MDTLIKCPICKNRANRTAYWDCTGLLEEHIICNTCNYEFEFAYGEYRETVGNKRFTYPYRLSANKWHQIMKKNIKS